MENVIYFDHSATTPVCPEAAEAMVRAATECFGNPSSRHLVGREAASMLTHAREQVMRAMNEKTGTLVFTSGGTESNNLAILGRAEAKPRLAGGRILTTDGEHSSVEKVLQKLGAQGYDIVRVPTRGGVLDEEFLTRSCTKNVLLATFMTVNNETGAIYDIRRAAAVVRAHCPDALIHTDATQAFLKIPCTPSALGVDMMTVSGHKIRAPKGTGALWISQSVVRTRGISARVTGGGQENDLRSGTENMPGIVAFGVAAEVGAATRAARMEKVSLLREDLIRRLGALPGVVLHLPRDPAPHILSLAVPGLPAETLLNFLSQRGICVSAGSACSSHDKQSHGSGALEAFGVPAKEAASTVRISLADSNTEEECGIFVRAMEEALTTLYRKK